MLKLHVKIYINESTSTWTLYYIEHGVALDYLLYIGFRNQITIGYTGQEFFKFFFLNSHSEKMARGSLDLNTKTRFISSLHETGILCAKEEPLHAEQRIFPHFSVLMIHELHDSVLGLKVCHHDSAGWVILEEL